MELYKDYLIFARSAEAIIIAMITIVIAGIDLYYVTFTIVGIITVETHKNYQSVFLIWSM